MASPQLEKGYTRISNELIQAMCNRISSSTWIRILLWTMRLTYGFRRKEVQSSYQSYATKLHLTKETIKSALADMEQQKIIIFLVVTRESFIVSVNKDYDLWKI
jgi:phage replication O-like protein O